MARRVDLAPPADLHQEPGRAGKPGMATQHSGEAQVHAQVRNVSTRTCVFAVFCVLCFVCFGPLGRSLCFVFCVLAFARGTLLSRKRYALCFRFEGARRRRQFLGERWTQHIDLAELQILSSRTFFGVRKRHSYRHMEYKLKLFFYLILPSDRYY